jgi:carbon monoxide dehydrogenase subunit G
MKLSGSFEVAAPIEEVWRVLLDPDQFCLVLPGCESARQIDATHYEATLAAKIQFLTIRAKTTGEIVEAQEPHRLVVDLVGQAMAGAFRARIELDLAETEGRTRGEYTMDVTMLGRLGSLGEPLVRSTAQKQAQLFERYLTRLFEHRREEYAG